MMHQRWSRLPLVGQNPRMQLGDRLTGRLWDYPRWLAPRVPRFRRLSRRRSQLRTSGARAPSRAHGGDLQRCRCHDGRAAFRALQSVRRDCSPNRCSTASHARRMSHASARRRRTQLVASGRVAAARTSVIYLGVHPSCTPASNGTPSTADVLHVGSTIPRKQNRCPDRNICRSSSADAAASTGSGRRPSHRRTARILQAISASSTASLRCRCSIATGSPLSTGARRFVLLPSDREGFGLPVVEAMACGTPVVASAIPALREIGGDAAAYCAPGDVRSWVDTVTLLLQQKRERRERMAGSSGGMRTSRPRDSTGRRTRTK